MTKSKSLHTLAQLRRIEVHNEQRELAVAQMAHLAIEAQRLAQEAQVAEIEETIRGKRFSGALQEQEQYDRYLQVLKKGLSDLHAEEERQKRILEERQKSLEEAFIQKKVVEKIEQTRYVHKLFEDHE